MPQRSALTGEQQHSLFTAGRDLVRSLALGGRTPELPLGALGQELVAGAFVSLKRGKHLRACCGLLGQAIPLRTAVAEAALRSVYEDVRFPPVSPSEVEHLDMELWLLHEPRRVEARGDDRVDAVVLGRHGVKVVRGEQQALFLPGVAIEAQWDARQFLDRVCLKAGLNASAWRDDATNLYVFEGQVLHGKLAGSGGPSKPERRPAICRQEDLPIFADFCANNIRALVSGITPSYYLFGAPDGDVSGAILTVHRANGALHFCQLSLRPGLPLQSTLFALCQSAAQVVAAEPALVETPGAIHVSLAILHDPVLQGTVAEHDLAGVDPAQRALVVFERNKSGIVFDPRRSPAELLAEAARQAAVTQPPGAAVYSLDILAQGPITLSTAPRPTRGPEVRPAAAAGRFYPADAHQLAALVDDLLRGEHAQESWPAAMVPHAGLIYSAHIAAGLLKRLRIPGTVIVIGPKHTPLGVDWAVAPHQTWAFPGGRLESDFDLAQKLAAAIPGLELDAAAHRNEHAIEVELPILARLGPKTRVVGIAIGAGDLESCRRFAAGLAGVLKECEERPLLLISSDMNHYANDAETRRLDAIALAALESLDPAAVYETVTENHISMCGLLPAVIVLETLRLLGTLTKAQPLGYATSAEISGDKNRVVGYAGMLFG
jgi:AmmeMemoRadiSam system protein B/AmmeMemoRadiSam system protein A